AAATGAAEPGAALRVGQRIGSCGACRGEYDRYREIEGVVGALRVAPAAAESVARARQGLESRLADLKSRLVSYRVFSSPLGRILIARSEHGVSPAEYPDGGGDLRPSRLPPIVVPCHRIIGTSGALTGYSGNKVGLKQQLLAVEGIQAIGTRSDSRVARNMLYHYDRNDQHEYCLPTCGDIARRPIGPVTLLSSRELAGAMGLVPCSACRPDLHPLAA